MVLLSLLSVALLVREQSETESVRNCGKQVSETLSKELFPKLGSSPEASRDTGRAVNLGP